MEKHDLRLIGSPTCSVFTNSSIKELVLSNALKILDQVKDFINRDLAQSIYEHTRYLGKVSRDKKDWETAEDLVHKRMSIGGLIDITVLLIVLRVYQIKTGNNVPSEIVHRLDSWRTFQLKPIIENLESSSINYLKKLIAQAVSEVPNDKSFMKLVTGVFTWNSCFIDWIRERPHYATGNKCGIHIPLPDCYEVTSCP